MAVRYSKLLLWWRLGYNYLMSSVVNISFQRICLWHGQWIRPRCQINRSSTYSYHGDLKYPPFLRFALDMEKYLRKCMNEFEEVPVITIKIFCSAMVPPLQRRTARGKGPPYATMGKYPQNAWMSLRRFQWLRSKFFAVQWFHLYKEEQHVANVHYEPQMTSIHLNSIPDGCGVFQVVVVVKAGVQLPHAFSGEHILSKDMFVAWSMDQAKMPNK